MAVRELPAGLKKRDVRSALRKAHAQYEALEEAWESLLTEHQSEWVAAFDGDFVFGKTIEAALEEARKRGWPLDRIAIDHLSRDRPITLL